MVCFFSSVSPPLALAGQVADMISNDALFEQTAAIQRQVAEVYSHNTYVPAPLFLAPCGSDGDPKGVDFCDSSDRNS